MIDVGHCCGFVFKVVSPSFTLCSSCSLWCNSPGINLTEVSWPSDSDRGRITTEDTEDTKEEEERGLVASLSRFSSPYGFVAARCRNRMVDVGHCFGFVLKVVPLSSTLCSSCSLWCNSPRHQSNGGVVAIRSRPRKNHHRGHGGNTKERDLMRTADETRPGEVRYK